MQLNDLIEIIKASSKIYNWAKVAFNLKKYIHNINDLLRKIQVHRSEYWAFDGLRGDISFGANGEFWMFAKAGASVRLRLDWKYLDPTTRVFNTNADPNLNNFIKRLLEDVESTTNDDIGQFEAREILVGLGQSRKTGIFGFGKGKLNFMGFLRFVKKPRVYIFNNQNNSDDNEDLPLIDEETNEKGFGKIYRIARWRWRQGLDKAMVMSSFFANRATTGGRWQINRIHTSFELSQRGWLGFAGTQNRAQLQIRFRRKSNERIRLIPVETKKLFTLNSVRLRTRVEAGFEIPWITDLTIYPDVEFIWRH
jgi:hypothetical protein